jgi:hypothetical protein
MTHAYSTYRNTGASRWPFRSIGTYRDGEQEEAEEGAEGHLRSDGVEYSYVAACSPSVLTFETEASKLRQAARTRAIPCTKARGCTSCLRLHKRASSALYTYTYIQHAQPRKSILRVCAACYVMCDLCCDCLLQHVSTLSCWLGA